MSGWPGGRPKAVVRFSGTLHGRPEAYREEEEVEEEEEEEAEAEEAEAEAEEEAEEATTC